MLVMHRAAKKKKGICALSHVDNGVVVFQGKGDNCENDFDCDPFLSLTCKNSACLLACNVQFLQELKPSCLKASLDLRC